MFQYKEHKLKCSLCFDVKNHLGNNLISHPVDLICKLYKKFLRAPTKLQHSFPGMSFKKYGERIDFLMKFLDLPSRKRKLINMSGGQQRRASLAGMVARWL